MGVEEVEKKKGRLTVFLCSSSSSFFLDHVSSTSYSPSKPVKPLVLEDVVDQRRKRKTSFSVAAQSLDVVGEAPHLLDPAAGRSDQARSSSAGLLLRSRGQALVSAPAGQGQGSRREQGARRREERPALTATTRTTTVDASSALALAAAPALVRLRSHHPRRRPRSRERARESQLAVERTASRACALRPSSREEEDEDEERERKMKRPFDRNRLSSLSRFD